MKIILEPASPQLSDRSFYLVNDYEDADTAEAAAISFISAREYDLQRARWELVDTLAVRDGRDQRLAI